MKKFFREVKTEWTFRLQTNMNFSPHIHDDIEIIYTHKGGGIAFCDGKKYELRRGVCFIAFPNQIHYYENCLEDSLFTVAIFKPSCLLQYNTIFDNMFPKSAAFLHNDDTDNLVEIMQLFLKESKTCTADVASSYFTLIFGKMMKFTEFTGRTVSRDCVSLVIDYCSKHYTEDISVFSVAEALHISKSYVSYIFSKSLLINFCEYINSLRISKAVRLLESEDYSVTKISNLVGFNTLRTFNRVFYKKMNQTPTQYRKSHKIKK